MPPISSTEPPKSFSTRVANGFIAASAPILARSFSSPVINEAIYHQEHSSMTTNASLAAAPEKHYVYDMADNVIDRERQLREEIERELPEFVEACRAKGADFVLRHQDAFAPMLGSS